MSRSRNGWNIGGAGLDRHVEARRERLREQPVDRPATKSGARSLEVVVGDRLGARHQAEGELARVHVQKRSTCSNQTSETSAACWVFSTSSRRAVSNAWRANPSTPLPSELEERDRVLHRELGAGADGEMRGRLGVAEEDHVVHHPALRSDHREIPPHRAVGDQPWPASSSAKSFSRKRADSSSSGRGRRARRSPDRSRRSRSSGRLVLVAMGDEDAVLVSLKKKVKASSGAGRAHPGELVRAQVDLGPKWSLAASRGCALMPSAATTRS
jgi:hypothetical protein